MRPIFRQSIAYGLWAAPLAVLVFALLSPSGSKQIYGPALIGFAAAALSWHTMGAHAFRAAPRAQSRALAAIGTMTVLLFAAFLLSAAAAAHVGPIGFLAGPLAMVLPSVLLPVLVFSPLGMLASWLFGRTILPRIS